MEAPAPDYNARIGTVLGERYKLTRLLGAGGMGAVYEGVNTWTERRVAVKVMQADFAKNEAAVSRFMQEARTATQIAHPNIVDVLDMGRDAADGSMYIVQEFLNGRDLRDYLDDHERLALREALDLIVPVMGALVAAHRRGVVHRDIKPENIFLVRDPSGGFVPKLIDFGISKVVGQSGESLHRTRTGVAMGTPYYMAPEQASGDATVDGRADVWSLGAVLYEMLAGRTPFVADNYNLLIVAILTDKAERIEKFCPLLPPPIAAIIHRALERDRDKRYPNVQAFLGAVLESRQTADDGTALAVRHKNSIPSLSDVTGRHVLPLSETALAPAAVPPGRYDRATAPTIGLDSRNDTAPSAPGFATKPEPKPPARAAMPAPPERAKPLAASAIPTLDDASVVPADSIPPKPRTPTPALASLYETGTDLDDVETRMVDGTGPRIEQRPRPSAPEPAIGPPPAARPEVGPAPTSNVPSTGTHATPLEWQTTGETESPAPKKRPIAIIAAVGVLVLVAIAIPIVRSATQSSAQHATTTAPAQPLAPPPPPSHLPAPAIQLAPPPAVVPTPVPVAPVPPFVAPSRPHVDDPHPTTAPNPVRPPPAITPVQAAPIRNNTATTPAQPPRANHPATPPATPHPVATPNHPRHGGTNLLTPMTNGYP